MSDLRDWLIGELSVDFGVDKVVTSKWNEGVFYKWTGMWHQDLIDRWNGGDAGYTTCTSFLSIVNTKIQGSGYAGARSCKPSEMDRYVGFGWHSLAEYFDSDQYPQSGDFFLNREGVKLKHVGLFYEVGDGYCTVIAGGGAGAKFVPPHDSIVRATKIFPLVGFIGWLNIDEFYAS
jgi:hypothetical protein